MLVSFLAKYRPLYSPPDEGGAPASAPSSSPAPASSPSTGSTASSNVTQSTPSAPATSQPPASAGPNTEGDDFSSIFLNSGDDEPKVVAPPPQATPAVQPPPVVQQPAPQQPVAPQAVAPAAPSPQSPPQAPSAQRPAFDATDPVSLARALVENEAEAIAFTAQSVFALSPEDIQALETAPAEKLPQIMAKGFIKSQQNMLEQMGRLVPQMVQRQIQAYTSNLRHEAKFFDRWKGYLNSAQHGDTMRHLAVQFRQMHPSATTEQMIEALGPLVMMRAGVNPAAVVQPQGNGSHLPPAANAHPSAGRAPQPSPFVPAAGVGTVSQPASEEQNPWETIWQHE